MTVVTKLDSNTSTLLDSIPTDLFIDGQWVNGAGTPLPVFDPSTGEQIATIANADLGDAFKALDAATAAAASWAATSPRQRSEILRRCYDLMIERRDEIAWLISMENGKTLEDARGEVTYAAEFFRWFAEEAVRLNGEVSIAPSGANRILVEHQPIGVAILVTPWNFPAAMATRKIAPALAAGCTCILKPATETPLTAYLLAQMFAQAGVPNGVINVVTTSQSGAVVSALLHDPRVRKISFTGSTEVGRKLLHEAADAVISSSMELGGNAPFIIFEDADLDLAVESAMIAKMRNGGEACTAANRFYVHSSLAPQFAERISQRMAALEMGAGYDLTTQCGPMITAKAVDRLHGLTLDAQALGATLLCGGEIPDGPGFFYPPTVLTNVPTKARVFSEEIFGPIVAITSFDDEEDVIRMANDTEYGLISYVFTRDLARGLRVSERMESGMVALNRGLASDPAAPFGGTKQSGLGREGAHHGILEFCETKYIAVAW